MNFKELHQKVQELNDGFDIKTIELQLIENELKDNLKPNIQLSKLVQYVLQMLMELNEYEQKNKLNTRMSASKKRLLEMLDISIELSGIGDSNQSFKLFNKELVTKIQLLRVENADLKSELKKINETFAEL